MSNMLISMPPDVIYEFLKGMDLGDVFRLVGSSKDLEKVANTQHTLNMLADVNGLPYSNSTSELLRFSLMEPTELLTHAVGSGDVRVVGSILNSITNGNTVRDRNVWDMLQSAIGENQFEVFRILDSFFRKHDYYSRQFSLDDIMDVAVRYNNGDIIKYLSREYVRHTWHPNVVKKLTDLYMHRITSFASMMKNLPGPDDK